VKQEIKVNKSFAPIMITGYFFVVIAFIFIMFIYWLNNRKTPQQPINFSHQIHVSTVGLPCTHCHTTVEKSKAAGIPPLATCMECHQAVATESPEIQKLTQYWEEQLPVPWERVYKLPARKYVYFSHKRHIKADLLCVDCHGNVEIMPVIEQVPKLEMGWCMSCHRERNASVDCATCHK
jgi:hypothetical protein